MNDLTVGSRVRIERDETRYPSRGSWVQFKGKTGTIVMVNDDEYGVAFGKVWPRRDGRPFLDFADAGPTWFKAHELTVTRRGAVLPTARPNTLPAIDDTRELVNV
jgi:hypothetical protein